MPICNLIEYFDNYAVSYGNLCQIKRDESPENDTGSFINVALNKSTSFKHKASLLRKATDDNGNDRSLKKERIVAPLKY